MVDKGLYSLSFMNEEAVLLANVEIKNKKHIGVSNIDTRRPMKDSNLPDILVK